MSKVVENTFIDENNENSLINENDENEEYQKNLAIFEDVYLPYKKYQDIIKEIQSLNNLIPSLKYDKQKDSDKVEKKILHLLLPKIDKHYIMEKGRLRTVSKPPAFTQGIPPSASQVR